MKKVILMDIDFDSRIATLYGFNDKPIVRTINDDKIYTNMWNIYYYFDVPIGINGEKWTFSWSQWGKKEQFFKLEQHIPFPKDKFIIKPTNYIPWTTLASWSYIAFPTKGTIQVDDVIEKIYDYNLREKYDIQFKVKGEPSIKNWTTIKDV